MRRYLFCIFILLMGATPLLAQPKHEVRAAWLTTAYGLDWPHRKANTPDGIRAQKEELIAILDQLYIANFNTILFQARTRGDVFYASDIEPYSAQLTGTVGKSPGYDPLAFVIEECHKRGMECHAWIVAIPLGNTKHVNSLGKRSITKKKKEICISHKGQWYLNPGAKESKVYLMSIVNEIISRYDIDGVHFDYLRYPENEPKFPDQAAYKRYGNGRSIASWRRDNLTEMLTYIYKGVKEMKPWVKVSSSPVGKYQHTARYQSGTWNAFHSVHQDVGRWLSEGIQDQIYPMMYFRGNNFYPFALDWQERCNDRHIIPGLGIYFLDPKEGNWKLDEIERQINFIRNNKLAGEAFYRTEYLLKNTQDIYDLLNERYYAYPALIPPMTWMKSNPPLPPTSLNITQEEDRVVLTWNDSTTLQEAYYVVYGSNTYPVDTTKAAHIVAQRVTESRFVYSPVFPWQQHTYYAVTSIDRYGNESEATQVQPTNIQPR